MAKVFKNILDTMDHLNKIQEKTKKTGTEMVTHEFVKDANFFVPYDQGFLARSAIVNSDYNKGLAVWNMPYARRLFYNPQYTFSKDSNPNARGLWAEAAKTPDNLKKYRKMYAQAFIKAKKGV